MNFTVVDRLPYDRTLVFGTHRDKLADMVDYLPNVDEIRVDSREEDGDVLRLVNHWKGSSTEVPAVVRSLVRPEMLTWIDRASWNGAAWTCDWEITLTALPEAVTAKGTNTFTEVDGETTITMNGTFLIHPDKIPKVPTFVAKRAAPALERFVVGLLQPNLERTNQAVRQYIEDNL